MEERDTCLTIVLPKALEEQLVDQLLEHADLVPGFTTATVEGHGQAVALHGTGEEVRGRARRVQVQIVMNALAAHRLVEALRAALPNKEVAYWLLPVTEFGRLA